MISVKQFDKYIKPIKNEKDSLKTIKTKEVKLNVQN